MPRERTDLIRQEIARDTGLAGAEVEALLDLVSIVTRLRQHSEYIMNSAETALQNARALRQRQSELSTIISEYIDTGILPNTAALLGIDRRTADYLARRKLREMRKAEVYRKHLTIMQLAGRGWRNARIADTVGCHPSHVSRVISQRLGRIPKSRANL